MRECPHCLAEGVGQERRAGGCYGAGRIRRDHAQTYFELSPPHPAIAPTSSAKTPRPITMPVPPAFITVPIRPCWTLGRRYQDKRYPRPRRGNTDREFLNDLATEGSRQRNCNVDLDDLRWDRPDLDCEPQQARGIRRNLQLDATGGCVRYGIGWRIPQLVGECVAKFGITWRVAAQLRAV